MTIEAPDQITPIASDHPPRIPLPQMFRLGLFQLGLGMMSVLTLGVINRVMIDELGVSAAIAAGAIAMHQFVAPARVWFGQLSDSKPLFGMHRTGYIWLGGLGFTAISFLAVQVVWQLGDSLTASGWSGITYGWAGLLAAVFAVYGLALSASSTPFAALLVDVSDDDDRSKLVSVTWSMLMIGIVIGAIASSVILKQVGLDAPIEQLQASVNRLFTIVPIAVMGLILLATLGIESLYSRFSLRSSLANREDSIGFRDALKVLTASRQTGIFFTFLLVMSISLFMQDAVMEPYGGEVFGMEVSETAQLNAFFGIGTLIGIAATGFAIIPRLGKQRTVRLSCFGVAIALLGFIAAGISAVPESLMLALGIFGLASGVLTAGAIGLMLDLTAAETAGTFIGAWGLAQAIARGTSTILGGTVLDLGKALFEQPLLAYGLVFTVQAVGMGCAIALLRRVNIQEFQDNARAALSAVMEGELD